MPLYLAVKVSFRVAHEGSLVGGLEQDLGANSQTAFTGG